MTHDAWVVLTGMLLLSAGGVMTVVFRLLGPTYHNGISGNWFLRLGRVPDRALPDRAGRDDGVPQGG